MTSQQQQQQQHQPSQEHQQQQSQQGSQLGQAYPRQRPSQPLISDRNFGQGRPGAANSAIDDLSGVDCFDW